jgi:hypothetical protein
LTLSRVFPPQNVDTAASGYRNQRTFQLLRKREYVVFIDSGSIKLNVRGQSFAELCELAQQTQLVMGPL